MSLKWSQRSLVSRPASVKYLNLSIDHIIGIDSPDRIYAGPRSSNLNQDMLIKLKAVHTLVEQLYTGSQRALATVALSNEVPTLLAEVLKKLSVLPQWFNELRRSTTRARAVNALSRAKAWLPELDLTDIANGYPSLKEDGTSFEQEDFTACVKEVRPVATLIADKVDLTKYQAGYDTENRRIPMPQYKVTTLIPPLRKHTFTPEVDSAGLIDDEAEFEVLNNIDWSSSTFQEKGQAKKWRGLTRTLQVNMRIRCGGSCL